MIHETKRNKRRKAVQLNLFGTMYLFSAPIEIVDLTMEWQRNDSLLGTATMRVLE